MTKFQDPLRQMIDLHPMIVEGAMLFVGITVVFVVWATNRIFEIYGRVSTLQYYEDERRKRENVSG